MGINCLRITNSPLSIGLGQIKLELGEHCDILEADLSDVYGASILHPARNFTFSALNHAASLLEPAHLIISALELRCSVDVSWYSRMLCSPRFG